MKQKLVFFAKQNLLAYAMGSNSAGCGLLCLSSLDG